MLIEALLTKTKLKSRKNQLIQSGLLLSLLSWSIYSYYLKSDAGWIFSIVTCSALLILITWSLLESTTYDYSTELASLQLPQTFAYKRKSALKGFVFVSAGLIFNIWYISVKKEITSETVLVDVMLLLLSVAFIGAFLFPKKHYLEITSQGIFQYYLFGKKVYLWKDIKSVALSSIAGLDAIVITVAGQRRLKTIPNGYTIPNAELFNVIKKLWEQRK